MDVGTPGPARLFTFPLAGEIGWILPFVLVGLVISLAALGFKRPLTDQHAALVLWAGWLIPEALYFTFSTGIMHAYYMIMMGAPLAALFAITAWAAWRLLQARKWLTLGVLALLAAGTILFQAVLMNGRTTAALATAFAGFLLLAAGALLVALTRPGNRLGATGLSILMIAVLLAPGLWSFLTTCNPTPNVALPYSGPAQGQEGVPPAQNRAADISGVNPKLLAYLLENHSEGTYLLATLNANQAAPFILATGLPVFTFGGFGGMDEIVDADGLAGMIAAQELRFVLKQGLDSRPEILAWLEQNCIPTQPPGLPAVPTPGLRLGMQDQPGMLYDCGSK